MTQARRVVAVVDDDPVMRDSLRFLLEVAGYTVETYDSGSRFLTEAEPALLSCLVLDHQMPRLTGLELLARLRERGCALPTLMLSSCTDPALAAGARRLGALSVIEKNVAEGSLLARIEAAVSV